MMMKEDASDQQQGTCSVTTERQTTATKAKTGKKKKKDVASKKAQETNKESGPSVASTSARSPRRGSSHHHEGSHGHAEGDGDGDDGDGDGGAKKSSAAALAAMGGGSLWERLPAEVHHEVWRHLQPKELFLQSLVCSRWRHLLLLDSVQPWKAVHDRDFGGPCERKRSWRETLKQHVQQLRKMGSSLSSIEKRFNWAVLKGLHVIVQAIIKEAEARNSPKSIFTNGYARQAFLHYSAMRSRFGRTPLFQAIKFGHIEVARLLVKHEITTAFDPLNTMRIAIKRNHEDLVHFLLHEVKLVEVNIETPDTKVTPIHWAARYGKVPMLDLLVKNGANVNSVDIINTSPLYIACNYSKEDAVSYLLKRDADPNIAVKDGATPLFIASQNGNVNIVSNLLSKGADVNAMDAQRVTSLYVAAQNGHLEIVAKLLEAKADVTIARKDGVTALHIAAQNGHRAVCQLLINNEHGAKADVSIRDTKLGMTPVFSAAEGGHADIVASLVEMGADVNQAREDGVTPLWVACFKGHVETVRYLLDQGAELEARESSTLLTPLCVAAKTGNWEICSMLIDAGANINHSTKSGLSPLFLTCANGHYDICALLIKHGAIVNPKGKHMATPLWIASSKGHHSIVYLLCQHKAKTKVKFNGRSPYEEAVKNGHEKVIEVLKRS